MTKRALLCIFIFLANPAFAGFDEAISKLSSAREDQVLIKKMMSEFEQVSPYDIVSDAYIQSPFQYFSNAGLSAHVEQYKFGILFNYLSNVTKNLTQSLNSGAKLIKSPGLPEKLTSLATEFQTKVFQGYSSGLANNTYTAATRSGLSTQFSTTTLWIKSELDKLFVDCEKNQNESARDLAKFLTLAVKDDPSFLTKELQLKIKEVQGELEFHRKELEKTKLLTAAANGELGTSLNQFQVKIAEMQNALKAQNSNLGAFVEIARENPKLISGELENELNQIQSQITLEKIVLDEILADSKKKRAEMDRIGIEMQQLFKLRAELEQTVSECRLAQAATAKDLATSKEELTRHTADSQLQRERMTSELALKTKEHQETLARHKTESQVQYEAIASDLALKKKEHQETLARHKTESQLQCEAIASDLALKTREYQEALDQKKKEFEAKLAEQNSHWETSLSNARIEAEAKIKKALELLSQSKISFEIDAKRVRSQLNLLPGIKSQLAILLEDEITGILEQLNIPQDFNPTIKLELKALDDIATHGGILSTKYLMTFKPVLYFSPSVFEVARPIKGLNAMNLWFGSNGKLNLKEDGKKAYNDLVGWLRDTLTTLIQSELFTSSNSNFSEGAASAASPASVQSGIYRPASQANVAEKAYPDLGSHAQSQGLPAATAPEGLH